MNKEPNVSVAILSNSSIECILYGEFATELTPKLLNGKISAMAENGMIKFLNDEM